MIKVEDNSGYYEIRGKEIPLFDNKLISKLSKFSSYAFPNLNFPEKNIHVISFKGSKEKKPDSLNKNLVLNLRKNEDNDNSVYVKSGNYIGVIYDSEHKLKIEITSRFGDYFLEHMLKYINGIFLPDLRFSAKKKDTKNANQFQFILSHLFITSLERAVAVAGIPKTYIKSSLHSYTVRGKIDIQHLIQKNIPLRSKIQSNYKEQVEIQVIIDVLYLAICIVEKKYQEIIKSRIHGVKVYLKENKSSKFVNQEYIKKALNHKILSHPVYSTYQQVLKYAEMIINNFELAEDDKGDSESRAYLIDVSELFELYFENMLSNKLHLEGWTLLSQKEIILYEDSFFKRKIKPDVVLIHEASNNVAVFDIKYKRMNFKGNTSYDMGDLDRNDFFQIHTYMAYYQNSNKNLIGGGLWYPIEEALPEKKATTGKFMDKENIFFGVDGINLTNLKNIGSEEFYSIDSGIVSRENEFVERLISRLNQSI